MTSQTEGKYILFMWNDYRIIPLIIDKERWVLDYWRSHREDLLGWMIEGSNVPQERRDLYDKAISTHVKSIGDLWNIFDEVVDVDMLFYDAITLEEMCPEIPDGEYVWIERIQHDVPRDYFYTVLSQTKFDGFGDALEEATSEIVVSSPESIEAKTSTVFWVAPPRDDGTMAHDKAKLLDFCLGCTCTAWLARMGRAETLDKTRAYEYEPER